MGDYYLVTTQNSAGEPVTNVRTGAEVAEIIKGGTDITGPNSPQGEQVIQNGSDITKINTL